MVVVTLMVSWVWPGPAGAAAAGLARPMRAAASPLAARAANPNFFTGGAFFYLFRVRAVCWRPGRAATGLWGFLGPVWFLKHRGQGFNSGGRKLSQVGSNPPWRRPGSGAPRHSTTQTAVPKAHPRQTPDQVRPPPRAATRSLAVFGVKLSRHSGQFERNMEGSS